MTLDTVDHAQQTPDEEQPYLELGLEVASLLHQLEALE